MKCSKATKDFWLRFLYLYPDEISDELIALMQSDPRICPYLDMPIQHINNEMLKEMRRKTSKEEIIATLLKLRRKNPSSGHPHQPDGRLPRRDRSAVRRAPRVHPRIPARQRRHFQIFARRRIPLGQIPGPRSEEVKEKRFQRLVKAQMKMIRKRNKRYVGERLTVMVEGFHPESEY